MFIKVLEVHKKERENVEKNIKQYTGQDNNNRFTE